MSIPLKEGTITIAHANSDKNMQVYIAAEAIWGIKSDKLPQEKFDELKAVLVGQLEKEYGPYTVRGIGDAFVITMDPEVLETSYKKRPCSRDTCMVTTAAYKCANCMKARYCSKDHQIQDWQRHKVECISKK